MRKTEKQCILFFTDFVSNTALPAFLNGKLGWSSILQCAFALDDTWRCHIEIANAYTDLLSGSTVKKLLYIEENCRHYPDHYEWDIHLWKPCWQNADMSRAHFHYLSDEQYLSVLKLGTFHADGYCRQICMEELSGYTDTLPFFILRMNDWVEAIRERAFLFACDRLMKCSMHELLSAMPMLDKLRNSSRRKTEYLKKTEELFTASLASKAQTIDPCMVHTYDITIKNSIYRFVNRNPILPQNAMETLLHYAKDSYGKRMILLGILYHYDCDTQRIEEYLKSKSSVVRYETLVYRYYTKEKAPWEGLSDLLMDKTKRVRMEASYILKKHNVLNVLDYYKGKLAEHVSTAALYGIGEQGGYNEIALITPYLEDEDERLARAALTAYTNLMAEKGRDFYWSYLLGGRASVCRHAYLAIKKFDIHYGAETLYNEYQKQDDQLSKKYLLDLLCREPSTWGRLPYLLMLCVNGDVPKEKEYAVSKAINKRSMYARVSQEEAQRIRDILNELARAGTMRDIDKLRKDIEFELKFVVT